MNNYYRGSGYPYHHQAQAPLQYSQYQAGPQFFHPNPQELQACRDRCFQLGYRPGTPNWRNCVHGCMGY
ncbi:hypothetical protein [Halobacillus sp. A5]|uniref:hypothetical protein n=1 Tax=Halobacillus sp. A5 TaxID=2880263 RepID=UPI0020A645A6|nr:hypothetical protein [Halobacillus sp. A5]MCP3027208.1 hypothetical protein [Halobacillus sp. A5]